MDNSYTVTLFLDPSSLDPLVPSLLRLEPLRFCFFTMYCGTIAVRGSLFPGIPEKPTDTSQIALSGEGKHDGTCDPTTLVPFVSLHTGLMTSAPSDVPCLLCYGAE